MQEQQPPDTGLPPSHTPCALYSRSLAGHTVVELHGEIDLSAATELRFSLDTLTRRPHPRLIVDIRPVTFMDCSGLSLLTRADLRVRERGGRLLLVCATPMILRMLRATGLDRDLACFATIDDALSADDMPQLSLDGLTDGLTDVREREARDYGGLLPG